MDVFTFISLNKAVAILFNKLKFLIKTKDSNVFKKIFCAIICIIFSFFSSLTLAIPIQNLAPFNSDITKYKNFDVKFIIRDQTLPEEKWLTTRRWSKIFLYLPRYYQKEIYNFYGPIYPGLSDSYLVNLNSLTDNVFVAYSNYGPFLDLEKIKKLFLNQIISQLEDFSHGNITITFDKKINENLFIENIPKFIADDVFIESETDNLATNIFDSSLGKNNSFVIKDNFLNDIFNEDDEEIANEEIQITLDYFNNHYSLVVPIHDLLVAPNKIGGDN